VTACVLVAGIGNIFLRDDGFGPEVARRMLASDRDGAALPDGVRVVDYGIRGMHLAYDLLDGVDALVLVDAVPGDGPAGSVSVLEVGPDDLGEGDFDAHGMDPVAVLASLSSLGGELPPTYVVGCQPADVSEGIGLSTPVAAAIEEAVATVRNVISERLAAGVPAGKES
jgi:hydrogenase maturation protease